MTRVTNALQSVSERHTPEYKIFKKPFCCQTPDYELISDEAVEKFGTFTTGDRSMDMQRARMTSNCWLSINQILEIFQGGGYVRLVNYSTDVAIIHKIIQEYLEKFVGWQNEKNRGGLGIHDEAKFRKVADYCRQLDELGKMIHGRAASRRIERTPQKVLNRAELLERSLIDRMTDRDQATTPDYVPFTERINYAALRKPKRY
jgi:hypothetical protein